MTRSDGRLQLVSALVFVLVFLGPVGTVLGQAPKPSPPPVPVPDVERRSEEEARALIAKSGLAVGAITRVPHNTPEGTVIDQRPSAGMHVARGTAVALKLSTGPPRTKIPDVIH